MAPHLYRLEDLVQHLFRTPNVFGVQLMAEKQEYLVPSTNIQTYANYNDII